MDNGRFYGRLKVTVTSEINGSPIADATVDIPSEKLSGKTNLSGEVVFILPASAPITSQIPGAESPCKTYDIKISKAGYVTVSHQKEQIYHNVVTLRTVLLTRQRAGEATEKSFVNPEHKMLMPTENLGGSEAFGAAPAAVTFGDVIIPEKITVHLGSPYEEAEDLTLPYIDYLKNVIAGEIYPTWPESSLIANAFAQNSLALNRVYTEWYPSQGFDFQITSSTSVDQSFAKGRSTFDTTNAIVERFFTKYLSKNNASEPLFTQYCDGDKTTCDGLSQWGTVSLANRGYTYEQILSFYYGSGIRIRTAEVERFEPSFPGVLKRGDSGENVRNIQTRLNRIAIDYYELPFVLSVSSDFGVDTEISVRAFQRIFGLPITGTVDEETWYEIQYIYVAVKDLATLKTEGELPDTDIFNGTELKDGSRGLDVLRIQWYLNRISAYLEGAIPSVTPTGIFNEETEEAARRFQRFFGIDETGTVNEYTWNRIVDTYYRLKEREGEEEDEKAKYPGSPLSRGSRGDSVLMIQRMLNVINNSVAAWDYIIEDGIFGENTQSAVIAFQNFFSLPADGAVGQNTWNRIVEIYNAIPDTDSQQG